jgi:para-nitrobenzyl esterase
VLGYLSHPTLGAESGNYGFLDQQAALRWVRDSIAAFGGDKDNVTLFGLGVGANNVCVHLASPTSAGLFHRAAAESAAAICGAEIYFNPGLELWATQARAEVQGGRLAAQVGCDTAADVAACLRAKPQEELRHAVAPPDIWSGAGEWWGAHGGTADVPQRPLDAIEAGTFNKVPVILATARDETSYWFLGMQDITEAEVVAATEFGWGAHAQDVIALYPFSDYETPAHAAVAGTTDTWYHCPYRRAARDIAAWDVPVYFAYSTFEPPSAADPFLGAFQVTFECLLFHQDGDWCPTCLWQGTFTPEEHALSLAIMDYWIRFFRTGDPNGDGAYAWPKFETGFDQHLVVDVPFGDDQAFHEEICDFYESL